MKLSIILFFTCLFSVQTTDRNILDLNWKYVATRMPDEWYGSDEAKAVADSVLKYQTEMGGWPKNSGFHNGKVKQEEAARIKSSGIGATIDNGATTTELYFLAKVYAKTNDERYRVSFLKGVDYLLKAQYPNGGWPQFYPFRKGKSVAYASHITYNDNAMVNVMNFLFGLSLDEKQFLPLKNSEELKQKAKASFDKGVECILKTQIVVDGKPTVWCAQHDEFTLLPANARAYELASFSGGESASITLLLMGIENPSKEIVRAVEHAVTWFETHKIEGVRLQSITNSEGQSDLELIEDKTAPSTWARFYDLETGKPFFCDRDGIKRNSFAELGYNRRNGYDWFTESPAKVFKAYAEWKKQLNGNQENEQK